MARLGSIAFVQISPRTSAPMLGTLVLQPSACARYQRYRPAPLPESTEATIFAAHGVATPDTHGTSGNSHWPLSPSARFSPKHSVRIARARSATLATQLRLESTAWQAAVDARASALTAFGADVDLADGRAEQAQLRTVLSLLRVRYREGQIARTDLVFVRTIPDALAGDPPAKAVALDGLSASIIAAGLINTPLKYAVGRSRPSKDQGACHFAPLSGNDSFASGHTTQAFALATVIAEQCASLGSSSVLTAGQA